MRQLLLLFALAFVLNSCGTKSTKFEGTWQNIGNTGRQLEISKSGDNFIIQASYGDMANKKIPATYNKEQDKLEINAGMGTEVLIYDANSKHILVSGLEFEKIK